MIKKKKLKMSKNLRVRTVFNDKLHDFLCFMQDHQNMILLYKNTLFNSSGVEPISPAKKAIPKIESDKKLR